MSAIFSFVGWTFLPGLITNWTVTIWYRLITRAGDPLPGPGHPRHARAHKRVFISVISLYLLYTIYESYYVLTQTPTFYDLLSTTHSATSAELKSRFRRLSILFHPDKAGATGAQHFVALKQAYDTLSDPTRRFAYDRFGADMLEWKHCSSLYDYVLRGAQALIPYYGVTLVVLIVLSVLGKFELGRWWRFLVLMALAIFEGMLLTRPYPLLPTLPFTKPLLAFQHAVLARKIVLTSFIALNQLGPFLERRKVSAGASLEALDARTSQMLQVATFVESEAAKAQTTEFLPFSGDPAAMGEVKRKMGEWLVESAVRNDPEVKDALGNALKRRRQGAPPGAKGTK